MADGYQIAYAFIGGVAPALLWLIFWLREDLHPEPRRLIVKAFFAGALAIPLALIFEGIFYCGSAFLFLFSEEARFCGTDIPILGHNIALANIVIILSFAFAEELVKYRAAKSLVLNGKDFDEPVDAMIYLITVALGFAAFENFFFLIPAFSENLFEGLIIGNLRFLGATLLHTISSGAVGYMLALSFWKQDKRRTYLFSGILIATIIHALFNMAVMSEKSAAGEGIEQAFAMLIITGVLLIFAFDRAKRIKQASRYYNQR